MIYIKKSGVGLKTTKHLYDTKYKKLGYVIIESEEPKKKKRSKKVEE